MTRTTQRPELRIVLSEAILRRAVGGSKVMSEQLSRLIEVGELPNVSIRMLPFAAGLHYGIMSGPFALLEFPLNSSGQPTEPPTVYVDGFTGALFLDKPGEIEQYSGALQNIMSIASSEPESRDAIAKAAEQLGS